VYRRKNSNAYLLDLGTRDDIDVPIYCDNVDMLVHHIVIVVFSTEAEDTGRSKAGVKCAGDITY